MKKIIKKTKNFIATKKAVALVADYLTLVNNPQMEENILSFYSDAKKITILTNSDAVKELQGAQENDFIGCDLVQARATGQKLVKQENGLFNPTTKIFASWENLSNRKNLMVLVCIYGFTKKHHTPTTTEKPTAKKTPTTEKPTAKKPTPKKTPTTPRVYRYGRDELISLLNNDSINHKKAVYSNNILVAMLERLPVDFVATVGDSRGGCGFTRGDIFECIFYSIVTGVHEVKRAPAGVVDLDTTELDASRLKYVNGYRGKIEIKFSSSYAYASPLHSENAEMVVIGSPRGIAIIERKYIVCNKSKHINYEEQPFKYMIPLKEVMDLLGF